MEDITKEFQGNFGFGCMRLPMKDGQVDTNEFSRMIDAYLNAGFCYFDTAHGYLEGKSETALRECLVQRYPRGRYFLTDKLSGSFLSTPDDVVPFFENQLAACGVDYFDLYLMHSQSAQVFEKLRHFGISFHDTAPVLEQILNAYPEIEVVQLQFNYVDYEDPAVQSRKCYEVCRKYGKPILVMEPVKGGHLADPPEAAPPAMPSALPQGFRASPWCSRA